MKGNNGLLGELERLAESSKDGNFSFTPDAAALSDVERESALLLRLILSRLESFAHRDLERYQLASGSLGAVHWDLDIEASSDPQDPAYGIAWTPELRRLLGYSEDAVLPPFSATWMERMHPEDRNRVLAAMQSHFADLTGQTPYSAEYRMLTANGEYRSFRVTGDTARDKDGAPLRMAGTMEDITERLQQQEMLGSILNGLDALITVCDPYDFKVYFLNDSIRKYFGIERSGVGEYCYQILQHRDEPCLTCPYQQLREDPDKTIVYDHRDLVKGGILHKTARLIDWPGGKKAHLEYAIDITSLLETEEALERRERMLDALHKMASMLLSLRTETFEEAMTAGVTHIANVACVDSVTIYRNAEKPDGLYMSQIYRWSKAAGGHVKPLKRLQDLPFAKNNPRWETVLAVGECVNGRARDLPEGKDLLKNGCKAVLAVPVFSENRFWGYVLFINLTDECEYDGTEVDILRSAAFMLTNAVIRNEESVKLRAADEHLKLMLDATPLSIVMWNEDRQIIDCNETAVVLQGYTDKSDFIAHFYKGFAVNEDEEVGYRYIQDKLDQAFAKGSCECSGSLYTPNGTQIDVSVLFVRIKNGDGFVVVGYARDIREHNRMMREIDRQNHLLQTVNRVSSIMLSSTADIFYGDLLRAMEIVAETVEVDHVFVWKTYREDGVLSLSHIHAWPGPTQRQPQGEPIAVPPDWYALLTTNRCVKMLAKDCSDVMRQRLQKRGVVSIILVPVFLYGEFWGGLSFDDVRSERIFTEQDEAILRATSELIAEALVRHGMEESLQASAVELQHALTEAQAASVAKSEFLSSMSHEMRTPLNAVIGMTAIGRRSADAERKNYALDRIEEASTYLLGVINDILDMSKIEAGKLELSPVEFNFEQMLQKVITVISYRVNEKKQQFRVNLDGKVPQFLVGDDQRLAQVITNLLSNAVKFTPEFGEISIDVSLVAQLGRISEIKVEVSDNGIGISGEQQTKLFQSFGQAESGISREFGGTGLGLAISKRLVKMMDGRIWVESELGRGSRFQFTVKLPGGTRNPRSMLAPGVPWGEISVLAVDNSGLVRKHFKDSFDRLGVPCETAADGPTACHIIERHGAFDIYFIDWHMPGMDGADLIRWIKDRGETGAIVLISTASWEDIQEKVKLLGADKALTKPIFSSALVDCMNECLGNPHDSMGGDSTGEFEGKTVLLAEDIEINREIVQSLLEDTGVRIDCAENGQEALAMMEADAARYDLVLMDMQMPVMDGLEATRRIRALPDPRCREVPIVAMTANVFKDDIDNCLNAGMNDHLGKPINLDEMLNKLRTYLLRSEYSLAGRLTGPKTGRSLFRADKEPSIRLTEGLSVSLDIRIAEGKKHKKTLSLPSVVEEVYPDRSFLIRMPVLQNAPYPLPQGEMFLLYFFIAAAGQEDGSGTFTVPVRYLERIERDGSVYAKMQPLGEIERSQRRASYRLSLVISVSIRRTSGEDTQILNAHLVNLSEDGVLLTTNEKFSLNERISLVFQIGEQEAVEGVVVRVEKPRGGKYKYQVAIHFDSSDLAQRSRLADYISMHKGFGP